MASGTRAAQCARRNLDLSAQEPGPKRKSLRTTASRSPRSAALSRQSPRCWYKRFSTPSPSVTCDWSQGSYPDDLRRAIGGQQVELTLGESRQASAPTQGQTTRQETTTLR